MEKSVLNRLKRQIKRGNFRLAAGELQDAANAYEKALELLPSSVEILHTLAGIYIKTGDLQRALRYYRDALSIEESDLTYSKLGICLTLSEQWDEAREVLKRVKDLDSVARYCLGIAELNSGTDMKSASEYLKEPVPEISYPAIALFYHKMGRYSYAQNEFRRMQASWKTLHARGVEDLHMKSASSANYSFRIALERYKEEVPEEKWDPDTLRKLEFDYIITLPNAGDRLRRLQEFSSRHPSFDTFFAIAVTVFEIEGYSPNFRDALTNAVDHMDQDQLSPELIEYWKGKVDEK